MKSNYPAGTLAAVLFAVSAACGDDTKPAGAPNDTITVDTARGSPVHVSFAAGAVVASSDKWDIRFDGTRVLTNGGVSGSGRAAALDFETTAWDDLDRSDFTDISYPDENGGPLSYWYFYDSSDFRNHRLYPRFDVLLVRAGAQVYKLQILDYYRKQGADRVAGFFTIRWSRRTEAGGWGPVRTLENIDATAGGAGAVGRPFTYVTLPADDTAEAAVRVDFNGDGTRDAADDAAAAQGGDWHLAFKRFEIRTNGGTSGAGNVQVRAMNLDAGKNAKADFENLTAENQAPAFEAVPTSAADAPGAWSADGPIQRAFRFLWVVNDQGVPVPGNLRAVVIAPSSGTTPLTPYKFEVLRIEGADLAAARPHLGKVTFRYKAL